MTRPAVKEHKTMANMDVAKVKAKIEEARQALNSVVDIEWKGKRVNGLRTLGLVENALALAEKHLDKAVKQTTPKPAAAAAA
jgi:hypothetical protein